LYEGVSKITLWIVESRNSTGENAETKLPQAKRVEKNQIKNR
jgi:hypothetical protein